MNKRLAIVMLFFLLSCRWDKVEPLSIDTLQSCLPDTVSLSRDLQPLFNYNCVGTYCHSGPTSPGHVNLDAGASYNAMINGGYIDLQQPSQSLLYSQMMSVSNPMPPDGRLDKCKTDLILKWIQQGAPNN
jgi:hypothetical protein